MTPGIFLIVQFNFPKPYMPEYSDKAKHLHNTLENQDWIEETLAASGGVGGGPAALWIFKLADYSALDRLLDKNHPVSKAYIDFFSLMDDVSDVIREEVVFIE